jgi:sodium-dependent dicarboxylate transporter 2/3/5
VPENAAAVKSADRVTKVLLVDDENQFRIATKKQLEMRGYKVWDVDNGKDAIKLIRSNNHEVVILDRRMPQMDGLQTLKKIKKIRPEAQVIMLTGYRDADPAQVSDELNVFRYLQKPCGLDELVQLIEAARQERECAMARQGIPNTTATGFQKRLVQMNNRSAGIIILGFAVFTVLLLMLLSRGCALG